MGFPFFVRKEVSCFKQLPEDCFVLFLVSSNCPKTISPCFSFQAIAQRPFRLVSRFKQLPEDRFALFLVLGNCPKGYVTPYDTKKEKDEFFKKNN